MYPVNLRKAPNARPTPLLARGLVAALLVTATGCLMHSGRSGASESGGLPDSFDDAFDINVEHITAAPAVLRSPYDLEARRRAAGAPEDNVSPPPSVAPVRDLVGFSFYTDA